MNKVENTKGRQMVRSMNTKTIVAVAIILAVLGAGYALARPGSSGSWNGMMGYGNGGTADYRGMMGGTWSGNGMMDYSNDGNGNHCGSGASYDGSGYGVNATP